MEPQLSCWLSSKFMSIVSEKPSNTRSIRTSQGQKKREPVEIVLLELSLKECADARPSTLWAIPSGKALNGPSLKGTYSWEIWVLPILQLQLKIEDMERLQATPFGLKFMFSKVHV
ncbi:hypothetical protein BGX31_011057 [Mortierella sp. GBA43]|nr:hypothetical protein BGX31_011057 [Mortierella sp. GBA43]